jgi:GGDEF domain-containing protein
VESSETALRQPESDWEYDPATGLISGSEQLAGALGLRPDAPGGVTVGRFCEAFGYPAGEKLELAIRLASAAGTGFDIVARPGKAAAAGAGALRVSGRAVETEGRASVRGDLTDVTADEKAARERWIAGGFDAATGLPNSFLFRDRLEFAIAAAQRGTSGLAVVFIAATLRRARGGGGGATDHDNRDGTMIEIARQLARSLRNTDTVARLSSDTFALVLPGATEVTRVIPPLERVRERADAGGNGALAMACGVGRYVGASGTADELIAATDRALVAAMRKGMASKEPFVWTLATR